MKAINGFYDFAGYRKDVRYFDCYGHMATGLLEMGSTTFYFDRETGIQAKDRVVRTDAVSYTHLDVYKRQV